MQLPYRKSELITAARRLSEISPTCKVLKLRLRTKSIIRVNRTENTFGTFVVGMQMLSIPRRYNQILRILDFRLGINFSSFLVFVVYRSHLSFGAGNKGSRSDLLSKFSLERLSSSRLE